VRRTVAILVGLFAVLALPGHVHAQESLQTDVVEVGWWSSRPTALAQPEKGFEVAAGPTGDAQSVAAIRLSIAPGTVSSLEVRLHEASALGAEFGILRVCTTTAPWTPANPGAFEQAPAPDCTAAVNLTRTGDGFWIGDVASLAPSGGQVSLMIVPLYQPPVPVGPGMTVTISAGEFKASGVSTGGGGTTDTTDGSSTIDPSSEEVFVSPDGGSFGIGSDQFQPDFGATTTTAVLATPTTAAPAGDDDFALDPIANEGESKPWVRLVLLVPLCAGFGVGGVHLRRLLGERGLLPG
jgi:hypothetical protein